MVVGLGMSFCYYSSFSHWLFFFFCVVDRKTMGTHFYQLRLLDLIWQQIYTLNISHFGVVLLWHLGPCRIDNRHENTTIIPSWLIDLDHFGFVDMEHWGLSVKPRLCLLVEIMVRKVRQILVHVRHLVKRLSQRSILLHYKVQQLQVIIAVLFPSYRLVVLNDLHDPLFNSDLLVLR